MNNDPTIATYDRYAKIYDEEVIDFWAQFPTDFIDMFVKYLPGTRVLDIGSGSGRDALLLRERGLDVVCVDASKAMVEITENLGFESLATSFKDMAFAHDFFDGMWAYTSLIHVPKEDAAQTIRRARAWLKSGGVFAVGFIEGDTAGMVERKTMPGNARYFKKYQAKEFVEMMATAGFELIFENTYRPHSSVYVNQLYKKID